MTEALLCVTYAMRLSAVDAGSKAKPIIKRLLLSVALVTGCGEPCNSGDKISKLESVPSEAMSQR